MKWIKTYTRLLESNLKPRQTVFVKYEEFPGHLRKFKEVLKNKFENSVFGVLDDNDVKLKELVTIKPLDDNEPDEKWIILHYIKEEYYDGQAFYDFFLRVYVLEENKGEFEKVLAFDAEKYPTIKKWEAVKADDQYQYKEVKINKKETQLEKDWENPKKVLIYKFSNKFNRDDDTIPSNKYGSGYKGSLLDQDRNSFPDHTKEVDFAEKFYIDNLIRSLKKNSKISKWIGDDGSVKEMPALYNKTFYYVDTETNTPNVFISLEKYVSECEGEHRDYFENIGYIPLNELLKEMIGILGYDTKDWELKFVSYTNLWLLTPGSHSDYWYISRGEGICAKKEVCCFQKVMVETKENPKENLRYIIFDKVSKGIPQKKAEEIYNTYKDKPTAVVEPKLIFELPK